MLDDPQQEAVYRWERAFVESHLDGEVLSRDETLLLVAKVSGLLMIPRPHVRFLKLNVSCRAHMGANIIDIADWGRTRWTLLHEMAHLGTIRDVLRGDAPHGSAFVSTTIALYSRFLEMSLDELLRSARQMRLDFDERRARGPLGAEAIQGFAPEDL